MCQSNEWHYHRHIETRLPRLTIPIRFRFSGKQNPIFDLMEFQFQCLQRISMFGIFSYTQSYLEWNSLSLIFTCSTFFASYKSLIYEHRKYSFYLLSIGIRLGNFSTNFSQWLFFEFFCCANVVLFAWFVEVLFLYFVMLFLYILFWIESSCIDPGLEMETKKKKKKTSRRKIDFLVVLAWILCILRSSFVCSFIFRFFLFSPFLFCSFGFHLEQARSHLIRIISKNEAVLANRIGNAWKETKKIIMGATFIDFSLPLSLWVLGFRLFELLAPKICHHQLVWLFPIFWLLGRRDRALKNKPKKLDSKKQDLASMELILNLHAKFLFFLFLIFL